MVVISTGGLYMCMVTVHAKVDATTECVVLPTAIAIVIPVLRGKWFKQHTIDCDSERLRKCECGRRNPRSHGRQRIGIRLGLDNIGASRIGELSGSCVG